MRITLLMIGALTASTIAFSQEEEEEFEGPATVEGTFLDTRVINGHSVETLEKGALEFRIQHRFGDIAGDQGGAQTFFGLDNAADIRIALEYGVTDNLQIGLGRSKGTGAPYRSLMDGFVKYRILRQGEEGGSPVSLAALGTSSFTYMKASEDLTQVSSFPEWQHRLAYCVQLNVARKFGDRLSLALMPTMVHRNYVATSDYNTIFALGGAARIGVTKKMAVLLEYYQVITPEAEEKGMRTDNTNSLGIGFEWKTFGHNFAIHLTNSRGFGETQFIPYTFSDWSKGQFRLGFSISRKFSK